MKTELRISITLLLTLLLILTLTACNGNKPPPVNQGIDPSPAAPYVIRTSPGSEQTARVSDIIKITFNKPILKASLTTDVVSIIPFFANGDLNTNQRLNFNTNDLVLTKRDTVLKVLIDNTALQLNTDYQVTVRNVEDYSQQPMIGECVWKFSVGNVINEGFKGLCGTQAFNKPPSKVGFAFAFSSGGTVVTLLWQTPSSGNPDRYVIEELVGNGGNAIVLEPNTPGNSNSYKITNVDFGIEHRYRVIPVNAAGRGQAIATNGVTTRDGIIGAITPTSVLVSETIMNTNSESVSSVSVAISPDGNALAFAENNRSSIIGIENGSVRILTKDAIDGWTVRYRIDSNKPTDKGKFGNSLAFSPDGLTLAIGELSSVSGVVQLFNRVGLDWSLKPTNGYVLTANRRVIVTTDRSGDRMAFSPDGSTLAVATVAGRLPLGITDSGVVQLFHRSGLNWNNVLPTRGRMLYSSAIVKGEKNYFGKSIAFTPDSSTLAIGELNGDDVATGDIDVSLVHLFGRNGIAWDQAQAIRGPILKSHAPNNFSTFGNALAFSPDGKSLAVNDYIFGDIVSEIIGYVQLFTKTGSSWMNTPQYGPEITSQVSRFANYFGYSFAFSADNRFLAIGENFGDLVANPNSGNVQIFNRVGADWSTLPRRGSVLSALVPTSNYRFGSNVIFNPIATNVQLIVASNTDFISKNIINVGSLQFFDSSVFIP